MSFYITMHRGTLVQNRFRIKGLYSSSHSVTTYQCNDELYGEKVALKTFVVKGDEERSDNEIRNLEICKDIAGIPRFLTKFPMSDGKINAVVTSMQSDHLYAVLCRSFHRLSMKNTLRICYRLFELIGKIHEKGLVHRDIRSNTVLGGVNWNGEFELGLSSFAFAAPISPPPPSTMGMMEWRHESIQVNKGDNYTIHDDYVSAMFIIFQTQDVFPFNNGRQDFRRTELERKEYFEEHLFEMLSGPNEWMADLYLLLERQRNVGRFEKEEIYGQLKNEIPGFNLKSPIEYKYIKERQSAEGEKTVVCLL